MSADERPETYRTAAALMRERPGPWEVAYYPPGALPSDPGTKLCLVAAILQAYKSVAPVGDCDGPAALRVFSAAAGETPCAFYRKYGARGSAGILDTIAARLEAERA